MVSWRGRDVKERLFSGQKYGNFKYVNIIVRIMTMGMLITSWIIFRSVFLLLWKNGTMVQQIKDFCVQPGFSVHSHFTTDFRIPCARSFRPFVSVTAPEKHQGCSSMPFVFVPVSRWADPGLSPYPPFHVLPDCI